jgi:DeoR/GlpR family transcriptional regulator of sugar metabolism
MTPKLHTSVTWLKRRFLEQNKTIAEMAKEAKVTEMTIRRALEKAELI